MYLTRKTLPDADRCWFADMGLDGDGRDTIGAAPLRSAKTFLAGHTGEGGEDLREQAVEFTTPEDLLIALEEEMAGRRNGVRKPARELVIHVNRQPLEDYLEGKPIIGPLPLPLFLTARPPRTKRRRRRRGGRGRHVQRAA